MYAPRSGFKPSHSFNRKVARQRRSDSSVISYTYSRYGKESSIAAKAALIESLQFTMIRFDRFNQKA